MRFVLKSREQFCFAGLWEERIKPVEPGETLFDDIEDKPPSSLVERTFTIITTAANEAVRHVHSRMPVILQPNHYEWWLKSEPGSEMHKSALGHPLNNELEFYTVSPLIGDSPKCIEPAPLLGQVP